MKVKIVQGGSVFNHTWENVDLKSKIGNDSRAYLSFGAHGHHTNPTVFRMSNFAFTHVGAAPAEEDAVTPYFGTLTATNSTLRIVLDSEIEGANYKLADNFKVADGSILKVVSVKSPGVLDLGQCDAAGSLSIYPRNGCAVKASKFNGATEVLVDGGTLAFSSDSALAFGAVLKLNNGAKIRLEDNGTLRIKKLIVDGETIPLGLYGVGDADWIDGGTGAIATGSGLHIILR